VVYQHAAHISMRRIFREFPTHQLQHAIFLFNMSVLTQEARIIMAMEAIQTSTKKLSCRAAAKRYEVSQTTLRARMTGRLSRCDYRPVAQNLTDLEEILLLRYILDKDERGFPPRLADVEDMANLILESRGSQRVGKLWAHRFVQRRPELKTRFNRVYDFQRALCEDPELIGGWFRLVENIRAKYGFRIAISITSTKPAL
jgi:hypothetical protein